MNPATKKYPPHASLKISCIFLFTLGIPILSQGQGYTDLKDQGYYGSVMQVTTKFFSAISLYNGKWHVNDSLHPGIVLIENFNKEGNFIRKEVRTAFDTSITEYKYSNKENPGWVKKSKNGDISESAKISLESPDMIKEMITDVSDSSITELIHILDSGKRTKTLEEKGYDSKGKLVYYTVSTNEDDNHGRFWKVKIEDKLKKITDIFYYQLLKRDKYDNPTEIITMKNGKVIEIRLVKILYYP